VGLEGTILTLFDTHFGEFFIREMAKNAYMTNHWVFSLHSFCNDIFCYMNTKSLKNTPFGAVQGGLV